MRLIDADKFKEFICGNCDVCCETFCGEDCSKCKRDERCEFIKQLDEQPTVEERPKGKWIFKFDNPLIPTGYWECSECKIGRLLVESKFCPDCGADMRGDENETN